MPTALLIDFVKQNRYPGESMAAATLRLTYDEDFQALYAAAKRAPREAEYGRHAAKFHSLATDHAPLVTAINPWSRSPFLFPCARRVSRVLVALRSAARCSEKALRRVAHFLMRDHPSMRNDTKAESFSV